MKDEWLKDLFLLQESYKDSKAAEDVSTCDEPNSTNVDDSEIQHDTVTTHGQNSGIVSVVSDSDDSPCTSSTVEKQVDKDNMKQAADSSTGPGELETAWMSLQTALGKKSGVKPVMEMVNKLLETVVIIILIDLFI